MRSGKSRVTSRRCSCSSALFLHKTGSEGARRRLCCAALPQPPLLRHLCKAVFTLPRAVDSPEGTLTVDQGRIFVLFVFILQEVSRRTDGFFCLVLFWKSDSFHAERKSGELTITTTTTITTMGMWVFLYRTMCPPIYPT